MVNIHQPLTFATTFVILMEGITCYVILQSITTDKPISSETMYADYPHLRELDMSNQSSFDFPKDKPLLAHKELSLYMCNNCGVKSVYQNSLSKLPHLTTIELKNNSLEYVHPDAFGHNPHLDKIDLTNNRLITINPEAYLRLTSELSILDLSQNYQLDLNRVKLESGRLMIFSCNNCDTTYLDRNTLAGLSRLSRINLKDNPIERIDHDALDSLHYLKSLNIDGNRGLRMLNFTSRTLKRFSAENCSLEGTLHISNLRALESVNLRGNRISHLDEFELVSHNIQSLLLDDNEIEKIPVKLIKMPQMQQLCLDQNLLQPYEHTYEAISEYRERQLRKNCRRDDDASHRFEYRLPSGNGVAVYRKNPVHRITNNGSTIDLSSKNIIYIEQDYLIDYRKVEELLFDNNYRFDFQESRIFLESDSIEVLSMKNCSITALYENSFKKLPNLKRINLQDNKIRTLHSSSFFINNPKLTFINLARNGLMLLSVTVFEHLPVLEVVILDENRNLSNTEDGFLLSTSIQELSCANCRLVRLDNRTFSLLPNLRKLNLENNSVEIVEANALKSTLKYVNLRNNPLKVFEPRIDQLSHLETLCLDGDLFDDPVLPELEMLINRVSKLEEQCGDQKMSGKLRDRYNSRATQTPVELVESTDVAPTVKLASLRLFETSAGLANSASLSVIVVLVVACHRHIRWGEQIYL